MRFSQSDLFLDCFLKLNNTRTTYSRIRSVSLDGVLFPWLALDYSKKRECSVTSALSGELDNIYMELMCRDILLLVDICDILWSES